ncbi:MAG: hypothetical protein RIM99_08645 [Cyclobacteriaceae bacterium]
MIDSYKANRNLLKRRSAGKYKNFDTSYITDYIVTGKKHRIPTYKTGSEEYMNQLKAHLANENRILRRKNLLSFTIAVLFVLIIVIILF